ncbi:MULTISPECIES: ATP-binding protein [Streptomyces]|uniref:ATP-binding protein n=1 Tax=Streptomyces TaxID=1883 RepID=UPI00068E2CCE|nr:MULTISPECIES: ATP-binding protein [Streptomyces]
MNPVEVLGHAGDHKAGAAVSDRTEQSRSDGPPGPSRARPPGRTGAVWELDHRPESVGAARRITGAVLVGWGMAEDAIDQALLIVSELITNAVEHAVPPIALRLDRPTPDSSVRIEVDDGGPAERDGAWTASCRRRTRPRPRHRRPAGHRTRL